MLAKIKAFYEENKKKILATVSFVAAGYFFFKYIDDSQDVVKYSSFIEAVNDRQVSEVIINGLDISFCSGNSGWFQTFADEHTIADVYTLLINRGVNYSNQQSLISSEVLSVGVACISSVATFKYMMNQISSKGLSPVQYKSAIFAGGNSFDDYYGGETIKQKFRQVIDYLNNPQKYQAMGARIRRGVLFHGPPGTGKTLLARALANEAGCSFIKVVASQFQQIFVGVGPKRIRQLFQSARKCQNGCIIFIDEIDALGSRLNHLRDSHETTTTINQFLSQMDGFSPNQKVLIVAATNRIDLVDHAILRAGRFDLKIYIPPPNVQQRKGIFLKILQKKVKGLTTVDQNTARYIAENSENWCGADLETLINQSIYKAIEDNKEIVSQEHVLAAFDEAIARK